jgi:hypothetical protein
MIIHCNCDSSIVRDRIIREPVSITHLPTFLWKVGGSCMNLVIDCLQHGQKLAWMVVCNVCGSCKNGGWKGSGEAATSIIIYGARLEG